MYYYIGSHHFEIIVNYFITLSKLVSPELVMGNSSQKGQLVCAIHYLPASSKLSPSLMFGVSIKDFLSQHHPFTDGPQIQYADIVSIVISINSLDMTLNLVTFFSFFQLPS